MFKILYLLLEFGSSQCRIIDDFHLPNASLFWPKITPKEQDRVRASPFKKRRGRKKLWKKENGQHNKQHVHLVKSETTICTQHILDINVLLVLLVSFYLWMFGHGESREVVCLLGTKIARGGGVWFGQEMEFDSTKILFSFDTRNSSKPCWSELPYRY
jgi:hypothetical protein